MHNGREIREARLICDVANRPTLRVISQQYPLRAAKHLNAIEIEGHGKRAQVGHAPRGGYWRIVEINPYCRPVPLIHAAYRKARLKVPADIRAKEEIHAGRKIGNFSDALDA